MSEQKIIDINGSTRNINCLGCAREKGTVSLGNIAKTKYFDAHQDYEIPIPGFVIISSRRHIQSVDEFTNDEQIDFIKFLSKLCSAQRQTLDIDSVYLIQEEDTSHHFHMWMFPRYDWMTEKIGRKIPSVRPIMEYARKNMKNEDNLNEVKLSVEKIKGFFDK